jgi:Flp pilus assembly protein TadG
MTTNLAIRIRAFGGCERGAMAIEFALLAPFLLLMLAVSVELGRAYQAYRSFENTVTATARVLAGYPEYDAKARAQALPVVQALMPRDWEQRLNLQVTSLEKDKGEMTEIFSQTLFGSQPPPSSSKVILQEEYMQGETVIHVTATYEYVPIFGMLADDTFTMSKTYTVTPFFARRYIANEDDSPDIYVN